MTYETHEYASLGANVTALKIFDRTPDLFYYM